MNDKVGNWQRPIGPVTPLTRSNQVQVGETKEQGVAFRDILDGKLVKFSHHAENRLQQRGIRLDAAQLGQLSNAVNKADAKGAKESLVLFRDVALIVNVKNRTVVTAMDESQMKDNVFTQIDSAIIIK